MKKVFFTLITSILLLLPVHPAYALFGQKQARAEAEQRAREAEQRAKDADERAKQAERRAHEAEERANEAVSQLNNEKAKPAATQPEIQSKVQNARYEIRAMDVALVVVAVLGVAFGWYCYKFRRLVVVRSPAHEIVAQYVVIDAANVVRSSQGEPPSFLRLLGLLLELEKQKYKYKCFFDANISYVLDESGLPEEAKAYRALLREHYDCFIEVPGRTRADDYILDYAHKHGTPIISNDRYRDYAQKYPWIESSSNRRITFKAHSATVQLVSIDIEARIPNTLQPALETLRIMLKMN